MIVQQKLYSFFHFVLIEGGEGSWSGFNIPDVRSDMNDLKIIFFLTKQIFHK